MSEEHKPDSKSATQAVKNEPTAMTMVQFFETCPPGNRVEISDLLQIKSNRYYLKTPPIQLHCNGPKCGGERIFRCFAPNDQFIPEGHLKELFVTYKCGNCHASVKTFAIYVVRKGNNIASHAAEKYGEIPAFGPPTPSRLISLISPDRELFLRGRRSENQGLGIGAFGYYRRVVEHQKNRILNEIIKVSEKIGAADQQINMLKAARDETQFTKALDDVKDAIPQTLLIDGHNPMTLLHKALSQGLHAETDEECLELAHSIRVVLANLAERLGQAMKNDEELQTALSRLMNKKPAAGSGE